MRIPAILAGAVVASSLLATGTGAAQAADPSAVAVTTSTIGGCGTATTAPPATFDHVVWILYENKSHNQVIGSSDAPYLTSVARDCAEATDWHDLSQTSLTNYIAMTSGSLGSNGEITSNQAPSVWPQSSVSLFEQLGTQARELAESMPSNCYMKGAGDFVINHTAMQYYTRINQTLCQTNAVPLAATPDLSAKFTMIIPNKLHDMHRTPGTTTVSARVRAGDDWTSGYLPKVLASPEYQSGRTVVILTWDEATKRTPIVPFIVISPYVTSGARVGTSYNHYSLLRTTEDMLGISTYLGHAADSSTGNFRRDFNLVP
jgi:phosphatidylinositol-3-phosphatase